VFECGVCGGDGIDTDIDGICDDIDDCIVQDGVSQECGCNTGIASGKCDCDGNVEDCNGECGGSLALDECGICGGSGASHYCWDSTWVCNESDCSEPYADVVVSLQVDSYPDCNACSGGGSFSSELNLRAACYSCTKIVVNYEVKNIGTAEANYVKMLF
jgi:hypothetical protein